MNLLRDSGEICAILKEAVSLRNVPFSLLKTAEETTCFLINLTNLLFLHTLIFKPHGEQNQKLGKLLEITYSEGSTFSILLNETRECPYE